MITRKTLWISSLISGLGITTAFALRKMKKRKTLNRRRTKYLKENVQEKMSSVKKELSKLFKDLVGKEEWTLKIYSDEKQLKPYVEENNKDIKIKSEEIKSLSKGRQYFERKKLERLLQEKKRLSKEIHEELSALTSKSGIKKNWNQKVTGRQDEMSWNSVYLIKEGNVKRFLDEVEKLGEKYKTYGLQLEATGPWPCYYFAKVEGE
ncbi:GvpL/GvpF family gas vesicle protein [Priestia endophytica]|uniref:GvpL/GvpF family gas vesicle protein n=1 Tax=Priestia endophytica TaxID=135735 RepID=UPI002281F046|nr:GvpL/GvpF family gas vesicle protein [Priestia endophytica]MCY8230386.1 GvpL/GvpF family gas vesicle protein [Priestia endophytica]